jgi:hypothetical protein
MRYACEWASNPKLATLALVLGQKFYKFCGLDDFLIHFCSDGSTTISRKVVFLTKTREWKSQIFVLLL